MANVTLTSWSTDVLNKKAFTALEDRPFARCWNLSVSLLFHLHFCCDAHANWRFAYSYIIFSSNLRSASTPAACYVISDVMQMYPSAIVNKILLRFTSVRAAWQLERSHELNQFNRQTQLIIMFDDDAFERCWNINESKPFAGQYWPWPVRQFPRIKSAWTFVFLRCAELRGRLVAWLSFKIERGAILRLVSDLTWWNCWRNVPPFCICCCKRQFPEKKTPSNTMPRPSVATSVCPNDSIICGLRRPVSQHQNLNFCNSFVNIR